MTNYLSADNGWQPIGTLSEGTQVFIMTDPINTQPIPDPANGVLQPYIDKINELTALNAQLQAKVEAVTIANNQHMNQWQRATQRVANFFTTAFRMEDESVDCMIEEAASLKPERKYNFKYRVTGYVWQEATGSNADDAWDNIDISFDASDVEDLEYDDGGYEDSEELGLEDVSSYQAALFLRG